MTNPFPYILIRTEHASAQLMKHRGARKVKGEYFGPFASAGAVNNTLNTLQKAFLLRTCTDSVFEARTRPCMLYQIKRCAGPCVDLIAPERYDDLVGEAREFPARALRRFARERLQAEMEAASEALDFERAARLRDRLRAIAAVTTSQGINPDGIEEADVIAVHQEGGKSCVQIFFSSARARTGATGLFLSAP